MPRPGGSKKGFVNPKTQRVVIVDDCKKNPEWRTDVRAAAQEAYQGKPLAGPIKMDLIFKMPRPQGHFGTGRNAGVLKHGAPYHCVKKPDRTKLTRALEDALTGIIWQDDSQIVTGITEKVYANDGEVGAHVMITELMV